MRNLRLTALAVVVLSAFGGCESTSHGFMDCNCCLDKDDAGTTADVTVFETTAETVAGDTATGPEPQVGQPCTQDSDCELGLCLSNEFLQDMGLENDQIDIPNGLCSLMGCEDDSECGPEGACFDTTPFTGMPITICLQACEVMAQCRWNEGYLCYNSPRDPEDESAGEITACLADSLVVAIECDDGHCEGRQPGDGHCDELADCHWKDDFMCHWSTPEDDKGICIPDQTVVALECEEADCPPLPEPRPEEE